MKNMKQTIAVMAVALVGLWTVNATAESWDQSWDGTDDPIADGFFTNGNSGPYNKNAIMASPGTHPGWMTINGNPGGGLYRYFANEGDGISEAGGWTVEFGQLGHQNAGSAHLDILSIGDDTTHFNIRMAYGSTLPAGINPSAGAESRDTVRLGTTGAGGGCTFPATESGGHLLNLRDYHIFRLVREPGAASVELYIDNNSEPALSLVGNLCALPCCDGGGLNFIGFTASTFESAIDFVQFKSGAAKPGQEQAESAASAAASVASATAIAATTGLGEGVHMDWDLFWDCTGNHITDGFFTAGAASSSQFNQNDRFTNGDVMPGWITANGNAGGSFYRGWSADPPPNPITKADGWTAEFAMMGHPTAGAASAQNKNIMNFADDSDPLFLLTDGYSGLHFLHESPNNNSAVVPVDLRDYNKFRLVRQPGADQVDLYINGSLSSRLSMPLTGCFLPYCDAGNVNRIMAADSSYEAAYDYFGVKAGAVTPLDAQIASVVRPLISAEVDGIWDEIDDLDDYISEAEDNINDLQDQIDNIQLTPGPAGADGAQGPQGKAGADGAAGAAGADAPCAACADVTTVVFDALCKLTSPTSLQEALDCGEVLAQLALLGVNPCSGTTSDCYDEVMAGLTTLVQEKLGE